MHEENGIGNGYVERLLERDVALRRDAPADTTHEVQNHVVDDGASVLKLSPSRKGTKLGSQANPFSQATTRANRRRVCAR